MDPHDDQLSTRDIASPGAATADEQPAAQEARFEREGAPAGAQDDLDTSTPLLDDTDQQGFVTRWQDIQARFVDDPRSAVEEADQLVANLMKRLADGFASERDRLEDTWGRGEDVGTEDLRVALQRYRAFFHRLLST